MPPAFGQIPKRKTHKRLDQTPAVCRLWTPTLAAHNLIALRLASQVSRHPRIGPLLLVKIGRSCRGVLDIWGRIPTSDPPMGASRWRSYVFMNIIGISGLAHSLSFKRQKLPGLTPREYYIGQ